MSPPDATGSLIAALAEGRLRDPFVLLGPHQEDGRMVIRAYLPHGSGVEAVCGRTSHALRQESLRGLFIAEMPLSQRPGSRPGYRLLVRTADGGTVEQDDPYAFPPVLSDFDLGLFQAGRHHHLGEILGAHLHSCEGVSGVRFATWAPNATRVSVLGDWNAFDGRCHPMRPRDPYGVWELFIPGLQPGALYKFELRAPNGDLRVKADPWALEVEMPPATASVIPAASHHAWQDHDWMAGRSPIVPGRGPMAIYECHLGSWRRRSEAEGTWLGYRELGVELVTHCRRMGFTHIELLPPAAHPYEGSWGYQVTGQYAPNPRHGSPDDLRALVDHCHGAGIAVIVDFVPGHFPKDDFALAAFDGTPCFEYQDPREGEHRTWGTLVYNFRRPEVRNFLIAAALHWLRQFHIDGLRVDAVSSMLYRDYDRPEGEWVANESGGNANTEAADLLRELTTTVHREFPGVVVIAEESTAWKGVTAPTGQGGLGFDLKWNMGWMHDTLRYLALDPVLRSGSHNLITFHQWYAYDDRWVLPLSHDEVVHGKRSLIDKVWGDYHQRMAQLRLLYGYQIAVPGRPLIFQGGEFAQGREWSWERSLDWSEAEEPLRQALGRFLTAALHLYDGEAALHRSDDDRDGFRWVDCDHPAESVLAFLRQAPGYPCMLVAVNFTPVARQRWRLGVPTAGPWELCLDSDAQEFGGSGWGARPGPAVMQTNGVYPALIEVDLPPLSIRFLRGP